MEELEAVIRNQSSFVLDFYQRLSEDGGAGGEKNGVCSPISISMAMAMAAAGAKGDTLAQLRQVLRLPHDDKVGSEFWQQLSSVLLADSAATGPALSIANSVWLQQDLQLKPSFQEMIRARFCAHAQAADFQNKAEESRKTINAWVLENTKGKIEDLLPPDSIDEQTKVLLTNAIYFKGAWLEPFDKSNTVDSTFYLANGSTVQVPMMSSRSEQYIKNRGSYKVLRLPYHSDMRKFSMYVLLPNDRNGLQDMIKGFSADTLQHGLASIRKVEVGKLLLPKFKVTQLLAAPEVLKRMGLVLPFSNDADFSDMLQDPAAAKALYISDVFHKAFVEVNEEGTEAAAASSVTFKLKSLRLSPAEDFVADHPFLFLIREDATGIVLFVGHVNDPATLS